MFLSEDDDDIIFKNTPSGARQICQSSDSFQINSHFNVGKPERQREVIDRLAADKSNKDYWKNRSFSQSSVLWNNSSDQLSFKLITPQIQVIEKDSLAAVQDLHLDPLSSINGQDTLKAQKSQSLDGSKQCRQQLANNKLYDPIINSTCLLTFYWFNFRKSLGGSTQGTGFLLDSKHIVTARHNFYMSHFQSRCQKCTVEIRDAQNKVSTYSTLPSSDWLQNAQLDLALIPLEGQVQNFQSGLSLCNSSMLSQLSSTSTLYVPGYSFLLRNKKQIKPQDRLHVLKATYQQINTNYIEYRADTVEGLSGSPVILKTPGNQIFVVGMHLSRKPSSSECRGLAFKNKAISQINYWIQQLAVEQVSLEKELEFMQNKIYSQISRFKLLISSKAKRPSKRDLMQHYERLIRYDPDNQQSYALATKKLIKHLGTDQLEAFYQQLRKKLDYSALISREEDYIRRYQFQHPQHVRMQRLSPKEHSLALQLPMLSELSNRVDEQAAQNHMISQMAGLSMIASVQDLMGKDLRLSDYFNYQEFKIDTLKSYQSSQSQKNQKSSIKFLNPEESQLIFDPQKYQSVEYSSQEFIRIAKQQAIKLTATKRNNNCCYMCSL